MFRAETCQRFLDREDNHPEQQRKIQTMFSPKSVPARGTAKLDTHLKPRDCNTKLGPVPPTQQSRLQPLRRDNALSAMSSLQRLRFQLDGRRLGLLTPQSLRLNIVRSSQQSKDWSRQIPATSLTTESHTNPSQAKAARYICIRPKYILSFLDSPPTSHEWDQAKRLS